MSQLRDFAMDRSALLERHPAPRAEADADDRATAVVNAEPISVIGPADYEAIRTVGKIIVDRTPQLDLVAHHLAAKL